MPVKSHRRQPLRKHNTNRNKNSSRSWRERHRHFCPRSFWILVPAAKAEPALRQVFAYRDFFLKSPPSDASEHARLHAILFTMRIHPLLSRWLRCDSILLCRRNGLDPNRWRIAMRAQPRHAFTHFKRLQLQLIQVNHFPPLAKTAFHQQARQSFFCGVWGRELNTPEIVTRLQNHESVQKSIRFTVKLCQDPRARHLRFIAVLPPQRQLLSGQDLFRQAQYAAAPANQQCLRHMLHSHTSGCKPRCLHRHAEIHTVALPKSFGTCTHDWRTKSCNFQTNTPPRTQNAALAFFVVPTNNGLPAALSRQTVAVLAMQSAVFTFVFSFFQHTEGAGFCPSRATPSIGVGGE